MKNGKQLIVRKGLTIGVVVCTFIIIGILGSYAYFISNVGNNKNQEVTVETGTLALTFSDGNNGFNRELDFGESAEKTFTIENTGTKEGVVSVSWMNLLNTYLEGSMTYSFLESDREDGEYVEIVSNKSIPKTVVAEDRVLVSGITVPAETKKYYKLIIQLNFTDFDQTEDLQAKMETQFKITEGVLKDMSAAEKTLVKIGKTVKEVNPSYNVASTNDETADGLYALEDDYGMSYFYRGAVEDNYLKFAGFYWRIIRVNGDGSLRIIYDGDRAYANNEGSDNRFIFKSKLYNDYKNDAKYVGYMFGGREAEPSTSKEQAQANETDSAIKKFIDAWYEENIENKNFSKYIADSIFCNDRSVASGSGYGTDVTYYGAYERFITNSSSSEPLLKCPQKSDAFTKDDIERGNGKLKYPIGLITIDEAIAAGNGIVNTVNSKYYLYKQNVSYFWTMSPVYYKEGTYIFDVNGRDDLGAPATFDNMSTAPVINIKSEYVQSLNGTGTMDDPFELS